MARHLGSYMLFVRVLQCFTAFAIIGSNGFLINYITLRRLGLGPNMVAIEIIASIILFHNLVQIFVLHVLHKSAVKKYLLISLGLDLIFTGTVIANLTILSIAGVPSNCHGMTRSNYSAGDAPNNPSAGFVTVRFGPGTLGNYGELDIYCSLPQAAYGLSVLAIFFYMALVMLTALRIFSYRFVRASDLEDHGAAAWKLDNNSEHSVPSPILQAPANTISHSVGEIGLTPKMNGLIYGMCSRSASSASAARVVNGSRGRPEGAQSPPPYVPGEHIREAVSNTFSQEWESKKTWQ